MLGRMVRETWRPIPHVPGYEASSEGRIRGPRGVRALCVSKDGYQRVQLRFRGPTYTVHSLVLSAFTGPRPPNHCCNHKDRNRSNNRAANLEWTTRSQNNYHFFGTRPTLAGTTAPQARGERHGMAHHTAAQILAIHKHVAAGRTAREIAAMLGIEYRTVVDVRAGRRWAHLHPEATDALRLRV